MNQTLGAEEGFGETPELASAAAPSGKLDVFSTSIPSLKHPCQDSWFHRSEKKKPKPLCEYENHIEKS